MSEKKPQAGEWWEHEGYRVYVVGHRRDGVVITEAVGGFIGCIENEFGWKHLPDCDSFEWQPETFPQFYRGDKWANYELFVRFDSKYEPGIVFFADGTQRQCDHYRFSDVEGSCRLYGWRKLTQAEAESRVKKPEPVESPDDWVTQDRVDPRDGVDYVRWSNFKEGHWVLASGDWVNEKHGYVDKEDGSRLEVRCRRRDLPPMPQETPKREYVRCFASFGTCKLYAANARFAPEDAELKHDGTGFYLEDGK